MTDFRRYSPAEWMEEGVVLLVEVAQEIPKTFRRASWKAVAVAGALEVVAVITPIMTAQVAVTDAPRQYEPYVDDAPSLTERDEDVVPTSYWSSLDGYIRTLEPLPFEDDDVELPDPIV
jgi:hypothetical protein